MSERERSRRKKSHFVMMEAWRLKRSTELYSYTFSTCLKLAWMIIKGTLKRLHTKIVGVTFDGRQKALSHLLHYSPKQILIHLVREPDNAYDSNAIKVVAEVFLKGKASIGYINSQLAAALAPFMDTGRQLIVYDFEITGGDSGKSFGCNISYFIA